MIFRTLYSRLALTLFILLCLVGLILNQLIQQSSDMYQKEVSQKLNRHLAANIAQDQPLILDQQQINRGALDDLFDQLMVINPSIEIYLLDLNGKIIAFSAPQGKVMRTNVDLQPVEQFLQQQGNLPIEGDDPRDTGGRKVFSAAKIANSGGTQGYLYIVLGGEKYDDIVQLLRNSYILDSALFVLFAALATALLCGMIIFALLTRRLRRLGGTMRKYIGKQGDFDRSVRFPENRPVKDEVDELGHQFNTMAETINQQIDELQRMDGIRREMVANVSHDLRTPLTTMRGYLETLLLKKDELSAEEQDHYLQTALLHSQRLGCLVEELFELARLDSCESVVYSEPFSMGELAQDVAQSFQLRAEQKSIRLDVNLNQQVPLVYGDIGMIQRVLENLIENGLRHTPAGGRVSINVDLDSTNVVVRVADSGCGIPPQDVSRIFERFYQQNKNNSDSHSAGLGLAIVKRILELHGSVIKVRSQLNQGTTFTFELGAGGTA